MVMTADLPGLALQIAVGRLECLEGRFPAVTGVMRNEREQPPAQPSRLTSTRPSAAAAANAS